MPNPPTGPRGPSKPPPSCINVHRGEGWLRYRSVRRRPDDRTTPWHLDDMTRAARPQVPHARERPAASRPHQTGSTPRGCKCPQLRPPIMMSVASTTEEQRHPKRQRHDRSKPTAARGRGRRPSPRPHAADQQHEQAGQGLSEDLCGLVLVCRVSAGFGSRHERWPPGILRHQSGSPGTLRAGDRHQCVRLSFPAQRAAGSWPSPDTAAGQRREAEGQLDERGGEGGLSAAGSARS